MIKYNSGETIEGNAHLLFKEVRGAVLVPQGQCAYTTIHNEKQLSGICTSCIFSSTSLLLRWESLIVTCRINKLTLGCIKLGYECEYYWHRNFTLEIWGSSVCTASSGAVGISEFGPLVSLSSKRSYLNNPLIFFPSYRAFSKAADGKGVPRRVKKWLSQRSPDPAPSLKRAFMSGFYLQGWSSRQPGSVPNSYSPVSSPAHSTELTLKGLRTLLLVVCNNFNR